MINKKNLEIQGILWNSHNQPFTIEDFKKLFSSFLSWVEQENLVFAGGMNFQEEVETTTTTTPTTRQDVLNEVQRIWDFPPDNDPKEGPGVPFVVRPTYPDGVAPFALIEREGYAGYIYENVLASLTSEQAEDLQNWMSGQTMALDETPNGHQTIIYAWDYDRWLKGLPVID